MRSERDSFAILETALTAARDAGASEADAVFESTDQNISRFANSNLHQNMSEVSAELTLRAIVNVIALGDEATFKATLCGNVIEDIEPGAYDVILEPPATAEVVDWMNLITLSGSAYDDGSSFFVNNIGKQVVGANFTLADDALDPAFLPFPFDLEGLPKRRLVATWYNHFGGTIAPVLKIGGWNFNGRVKSEG